MRIRLDLRTISSVAPQSVQDQGMMRQDLETSLVRHHESLEDSLAMIYQRVEQRIGSVERLLKDQSIQLQADQFSQMGLSTDIARPRQGVDLARLSRHRKLQRVATRKL